MSTNTSIRVTKCIKVDQEGNVLDTFEHKQTVEWDPNSVVHSMFYGGRSWGTTLHWDGTVTTSCTTTTTKK